MNKTDFEEFKRLEDLLTKRAISPIDFWQRIRELRTISSVVINRIQRELFALEAKPYNEKSVPLQETKYNFSQDIVVRNETEFAKLAGMTISQVPLIHTTYNPAGHSHYIEARTSGEIMLHKLGYRESVEEYDIMIMGNYPNIKRTFERVSDQTVDYIEFSKTDDEIHFTSYLTRKTHAPYKNNDEPNQVTKKELEAIIQIITEWMD